jgi:hypothetical protein
MFTTDIKEILGHIKGIAYAPVVNVLLLFGFLLVIFSFLSFDGIENVSFTGQPKLVMLILGIVLLIGSSLMYVFTRSSSERTGKKLTIKEGMSFSFNQFTINLKVGRIQEISGVNKNSAVILPANTTFVDDCITDEKSALGAFFLKFYPEKISKISEDIERQLQQQRYQKDEDNSYPPGATIILPEEYNTPAKSVMTASTIRKEKVGIWSSPSTICECIRQIFEITADKKIEKLYTPVLGSGHGGLDINDALHFLILSLKYYAKLYHHIKTIEIVVVESDIRKVKDIDKLIV